MTQRKLLVMVGSDVATQMQIDDNPVGAPEKSERNTKIIDALKNKRVQIIPPDNIDIEPGWTWDGEKFSPPLT